MKRFSIILILTMMMSCLPAFAFAADNEGSVQNVGGKLVFFDVNGVQDMSTGWKRTPDGTYYSNGKKLVTSPTKIKSTRLIKQPVTYYWNKKTHEWVSHEIKTDITTDREVTVKVPGTYLYMFGKDGKLITKKGVFKYKKNEYCGFGDGALQTGWVAIGNKAMFFKEKNGRMAKNTKVGYLKIPKSGRLGKAYALGIRMLDNTKWTLRQAYKNSYQLKYKGRWYRAKDAETYAIRGFTKGYGNCYVMASTFYIQAKLLGYNVHQVHGKVAGIWPHSWTVIRQNGREWVYDPNFRNETGRNGWKIWYGKKGTWRYTGYSKMN